MAQEGNRAQSIMLWLLSASRWLISASQGNLRLPGNYSMQPVLKKKSRVYELSGVGEQPIDYLI